MRSAQDTVASQPVRNFTDTITEERLSLFRKPGGGFLNGVCGVITGIKFESKEWEQDDKDSYHTLTMGVTIRPDGADEDVQQFLRAGFFYPDTQGISDDGSTLTDADGNDLDRPAIDENSEAGKFIASALEAGVIEESDCGENGSNFDALVGKRVEFEKRLDKETQIQIGRRALDKKKKGSGKTASEEEALLAGRRQDKKDKKKFYNVDYLAIRKALGEAEVAKSSKSGKSSKGGDKKEVKAEKSSKKSKGDDREAEAVKLLVELLGDAKNNTLLRSQLSAKVTAYCMDNDVEDDVRDELRKIIYDEKFLKSEQGWSYDPSGKQPVSLAGDEEDDE